MAEQQAGVILNISSMAGIKPLTRVVAYSAAKAALDNFTQWLAVHMAQEYHEKIRVNAITPGFLLTEQNRYLLKTPEGGLTPRGQQIVNATPMKRFGEPDEMTGTILWLISDASKFVTGIIVPVDGGFSAFGGV
jgi:NAD(P)-dependent dehydrogenase (short-subunit alcohol dehydrogenase family)